jgi:hypothetical protein
MKGLQTLSGPLAGLCLSEGRSAIPSGGLMSSRSWICRGGQGSGAAACGPRGARRSGQAFFAESESVGATRRVAPTCMSLKGVVYYLHIHMFEEVATHGHIE